jgi:murein DD-endopeptidase MepM/ murein hydrolase activator NlpD
VTLPTGPIRAIGGGLDWSAITRYAAELRDASQRTAAPVSRLAGHIVIESRGDKRAIQKNNTNGWSYGLMQIVPYGVGWEGWHALVAHIAGVRDEQDLVIESLYVPSVNIATGAEILRQGRRAGETWDQASSRFFTGNPNWQGVDTVNGTNGQTYRQVLDNLIAEWEAGGEVRPVPTGPTGPQPEPPADVLDLVYGGKPYTVSAEYGQLITWDCPHCYDYFPAYGLDSQHHWAIDVTADAGEGALLYAPMAGVIVCAGTDPSAPGAYGTSCAAFPRLNNYGSPTPNGPGAGRCSLLCDNGDELIYGHVLTTLVPINTRVKAGDRVAKQGGMNASHLHLERRYDRSTKIGNPRALFGDVPEPAVERVPYDLGGPGANYVTVRATKSVPVRQRADPTAPQLDTIAAGETFEALAQVPGNDHRLWWLGRLMGRVPTEGTEIVSVEVPS